MDNDGKPEILHGNFGGYVTCLNGEDGSIAWDLAVDLNSWIQTEPIILDADNDGQLDFIVGNWSFGTNHKLWCFRGNDHQQLWESDLPSDYIYHGASFADIDNDGYQEIAVGDYSGNLMVLNAEDGSLKWDYSFASPFYIGSPTSMGDINNDGLYEIVFFDGDHLGVLDNTGGLLWDFYIPSYGSAFRGAALSDVNNDDTLDIVFGTSLGIVYALHGNTGNQIWNIDLAAIYGGTYDIDHAPVISDFDGDGSLDFFLVGGYTDYPDVSNNYGRGYAVSMDGYGGPDWLMFRRDSVRSARVPLDSSIVFNNMHTAGSFNIEIFPNPFINSLTIEYKVYEKSNINISIFDISGKKISCITDEIKDQGSYIYKTDRSTLDIHGSGVYFIKIKSDSEQITKKIFLMN
ncbi:MAG: FG-GAP-like repeat-containing protein [Bacteroidota bacterium]